MGRRIMLTFLGLIFFALAIDCLLIWGTYSLAKKLEVKLTVQTKNSNLSISDVLYDFEFSKK